MTTLLNWARIHTNTHARVKEKTLSHKIKETLTTCGEQAGMYAMYVCNTFVSL